NKDTEAYCVFVSTVLHRNTISDFRNRKTYEHYSKGFKDVVQGLKILPLATSEVQTILAQGIHYDDLYPLFERAYRSEEPIPTWYEQELIAALAP
ncbi:MAG: AlwI family type II restriction endonuclease, partial [Oscillospiraceae bacterium]|nr:AlwI family type II restriction endonuclease [Oscillospiraceae bacterium]